LSEKEYNNAQAFFRYLYEKGEGTEKNLEKAFHWYQKAAENGHIKAQNNLALLYEKGEGTEKNLEEAFYWYQKAAENGDIKAQYNLAQLYYEKMYLENACYLKESGHVDKLSYRNGLKRRNAIKGQQKIWHKTTENRDIKAQYSEETKKNLEKAFYWYQKATEKNILICG